MSLSRPGLQDRFDTLRSVLRGRVEGVPLGDVPDRLLHSSGLPSESQYAWFLAQIANGGWFGDVVLFGGAELAGNQFFLEGHPEISTDGLVIGTLLYDPLVLRSNGDVFVIRDGVVGLVAPFEEVLWALVSCEGYLKFISESADGWAVFLTEQNML